MPDFTFDGIRLDLTGYRSLAFNYEQSDMRVAYRRTHPSSWDELINYMERYGTYDNEFTPGEVVAMTEDLRTLKQDHTPFTDNPDKAYQEAHSHRSENDKKHAKLHQEIEQKHQQLASQQGR